VGATDARGCRASSDVGEVGLEAEGAPAEEGRSGGQLEAGGGGTETGDGHCFGARARVRWEAPALPPRRAWTPFRPTEEPRLRALQTSGGAEAGGGQSSGDGASSPRWTTSSTRPRSSSASTALHHASG
jgi:hypothetical protein